jgi:MFS family permease
MLAMLRRNRDLRTLFIAQVISYMGDWFCYVALLGLVKDLTDSSLLVALVFVAQALPGFLMAPVAGAAADRIDRRRILVTVSLIQAVAAVTLLGVGEGRVWLAFVAQATIAAFGAFVLPASQAAVPNLTHSADELKKASALFGSTWGAMLAIGAALGGAFASIFGRNAAFVADAVSFVVAAALVATIRRPMQEATTDHAGRKLRPLADMKEGLLYARRDPVLVALMSSKATFALGAGTVGILAILVTDAFHGGDGATGLLLGMRGLGVGLGPLIAARLIGPSLSRLLRMCGLAGLVFGACYLTASVAPTLVLVALLVFVAHLGGGAQWTMSTFGLQLRAPDEVRGRILAADFAFVTLILSVTTTASGALCEAIGPRPTMATFALLGLSAGTTYLLATRNLRRQLRGEELAGVEALPGLVEAPSSTPDADEPEAVSRPGSPSPPRSA